MFNIGDYVVYKRDVCQISDIKVYNNKEYYVMYPIDDKTLKINVPIDNSFGYIRNVLSKDDAENLISKIHDISIIETTDRMIENQYKSLLQSGKFEDLICIIKTTYLRNDERRRQGKKIGEIDDSYFKLAEKLLYNELSISLGKSYEETKNYIIESVGKLSS